MLGTVCCVLIVRFSCACRYVARRIVQGIRCNEERVIMPALGRLVRGCFRVIVLSLFGCLLWCVSSLFRCTRLGSQCVLTNCLVFVQFPFLKSFTPMWLQTAVMDWLGANESMDHFTGRKEA